jgi:alpha-L-arabinofuranosidase
MANKKISALPLRTAPLTLKDQLEICSFISVISKVSQRMTFDNIAKSVSAFNAVGSFYDSTTQTALVSTPTPMNFANTYFSQDINLASATEIQVDNDGLYSIQFSAQVFRTSGSSNREIDIWFRVNGADVPDSNTRMTVKDNNLYHVASWNIFLNLVASDLVEIYWLVNDAHIELRAEAATASVPATPSIIATINRIQ